MPLLKPHQWHTRTDWTRRTLWGALRVSWKVEKCANYGTLYRRSEIDLSIKSFKWNLYTRWTKWWKPSVDLHLIFCRDVWVMLDTRPNCSICVLGWSVWCESGISWAQAWAFKQLRDIHEDESFRVTIKGPKAMPYEFGIYYLRGLIYCAGLHAEFGVIGPLPPNGVNVG